MVKGKVTLYIMKHNMKEHGRKEAKLHGISPVLTG